MFSKNSSWLGSAGATSSVGDAIDALPPGATAVSTDAGKLA
jgi:hypothetical protein